MTEVREKGVSCDSKEVRVIKAILHEAGIRSYDPIVINQLLSLVYNYVSNVLEDTNAFCRHANKKTVDKTDVSFALRFREDKFVFTKDELVEMAAEKNSEPIPAIKPRSGVRLPADRYCLNTINFKLINKPKSEENKHNTTVIPEILANAPIKRTVKIPMAPQKIVFRPKLSFRTTPAINVESLSPKRTKRDSQSAY